VFKVGDKVISLADWHMLHPNNVGIITEINSAPRNETELTHRIVYLNESLGEEWVSDFNIRLLTPLEELL
jgi:hypothetical protein